MSLKRTAVALALLFVCRTAHADERDANTADVRAGYAFAWTTGLQYLGKTVGFAYAHRFWGRFQLEVRGYFHRGEEVHARGRGSSLDAFTRSLSLQAAAGYAIWIAHRLTVTPAIVVDTTYAWESTTVGASDVSDQIWLFGVGPDVAIVYRSASTDKRSSCRGDFRRRRWVSSRSWVSISEIRNRRGRSARRPSRPNRRHRGRARASRPGRDV